MIKLRKNFLDLAKVLKLNIGSQIQMLTKQLTNQLNYSEKLTTKKASPNHFTDLEKSAFTFRNAHQAMEKLIFTTKL